jgi:hypothetical protein
LYGQKPSAAPAPTKKPTAKASGLTVIFNQSIHSVYGAGSIDNTDFAVIGDPYPSPNVSSWQLRFANGFRLIPTWLLTVTFLSWAFALINSRPFLAYSKTSTRLWHRRATPKESGHERVKLTLCLKNITSLFEPLGVNI